jgi:hypothetical protein
MPGGGSRIGERRGGRQKGTPNLSTRAKEAKAEGQRQLRETAAKVALATGADPNLAEAAVQAAVMLPINKGLKETFESEIVPTIKSILAHFQRQAMAVGPSGQLVVTNTAALADFERWLGIYNDLCIRLMPYNYPTLKAMRRPRCHRRRWFTTAMVTSSGRATRCVPPGRTWSSCRRRGQRCCLCSPARKLTVNSSGIVTLINPVIENQKGRRRLLTPRTS